MSTKNLGRTAIEGGRIGRYKNSVRKKERSFRTANRIFNGRAVNDAEAFEEGATPVLRPKSKRGNQTDKLGPIYDMLDGMVGRPWAKVFSEICEKFDSRTLAGRHVLFDHILGEVDPHPHVQNASKWRYNFHLTYFVDDHGIFRKWPKQRYIQNSITRKYAESIVKWLDGRALIQDGQKIFWADEISRSKSGPLDVHLVPAYKTKELVIGFSWGSKQVWTNESSLLSNWNWRQNRALSRDERAFFQSIPEWLRKALFVSEKANQDLLEQAGRKRPDYFDALMLRLRLKQAA